MGALVVFEEWVDFCPRNVDRKGELEGRRQQQQSLGGGKVVMVWSQLDRGTGKSILQIHDMHTWSGPKCVVVWNQEAESISLSQHPERFGLPYQEDVMSCEWWTDQSGSLRGDAIKWPRRGCHSKSCLFPGPSPEWMVQHTLTPGDLRDLRVELVKTNIEAEDYSVLMNISWILRADGKFA
jgi:hypothetical protein